MIHSAIYRYPIIVICALGLAACAEYRYGYVPSPDQLDRFQPGVTTRSEVVGISGNPTLTAPPRSQDLYYISRKVRDDGPHLIELGTQVVILRFDDNSVLTKIQHLDEDDFKQFTIEADSSPVPGIENPSIFEDILANIGRFQPQ